MSFICWIMSESLVIDLLMLMRYIVYTYNGCSCPKCIKFLEQKFWKGFIVNKIHIRTFAPNNIWNAGEIASIETACAIYARPKTRMSVNYLDYKIRQ